MDGPVVRTLVLGDGPRRGAWRPSRTRTKLAFVALVRRACGLVHDRVELRVVCDDLARQVIEKSWPARESPRDVLEEPPVSAVGVPASRLLLLFVEGRRVREPHLHEDPERFGQELE